MKIVAIRSESELEALKPAWNALLETSASNTIFLTWEWIIAWWSAYGNPEDLRVLTAWDESDTLRGIAPLRRTTLRGYGQTAEAYSFIGDGSNDSEYLDCIIASGYEEKVMTAFCGHWSQELSRGGVLALQEMPSNSANLPWFRKLAESNDMLLLETAIPCGTVQLPDTWESYLATLKPRFRTKVRSVLRDMEGSSEVSFGFCRTDEDLEQVLPVLFDLHMRRWKQDGKPGVFGWRSKRDFYFALSKLLLKRGWLRLSWLAWNGRILACQYGFAYDGIYFHLQEGYEPASEHRSIGIGLRAWSIRELLQQGVRQYDFLGGMSRHKSDWGAEVKHSTHIRIARASYKNLLLCRGPEWAERMRESVKKIVPEKILTARRTHLEKKQARNGHAAQTPSFEWLRQGAASCYLNLRLPTLTRPLRDQYQLSISSAGRWPRLNRRREACARILYYHRVNDERDPFFPAISTELFEQEMRYIAQHYHVVPLGDLLKHLEDGSSEPVMAITFDDGYQDNYHSALPILRRYGLPATIFLTTGSMDSREPLWFEQLADAVKRTAREQIDIEIDIPRRFRVTTEEERLEANDRIFALLRGLTDADRGQWLERILKQLAVAPSGERNGRMLTWDQARAMTADRIDFGGHTVTHPFLSKMPREQAAWEVSECKRRIEEELQFPADYFAYPSGREQDFAEDSKQVLRDAGYRAAVTTKWGMNYRSTDRMELRRGGPWEETPSLFAYKLDWYQLVND
jgi:peptidoglycan/xylan/chitin deacetylase (PgdA/CDA1 family)/CelD/BcsL family acetyltransferase involved in cellulose biosynthesis